MLTGGQIKTAQLKGGASVESQLSEFVHWYVHSDTGQSSVVSPCYLKLKTSRDIRTHTLRILHLIEHVLCTVTVCLVCTHSHRNCLFRALADQQLNDDDGHHSNHRVIRRAVVAHMRENRDHFAPFSSSKKMCRLKSTVSEPFPWPCGGGGGSLLDLFVDSSAVAELAKDGQCAGNDVIVAFSCCYGAHVVIYQLNEQVVGGTRPPHHWSHKSSTHVAYLMGTTTALCCPLLLPSQQSPSPFYS